jgi:hypothetical protein
LVPQLIGAFADGLFLGVHVCFTPAVLGAGANAVRHCTRQEFRKLTSPAPVGRKGDSARSQLCCSHSDTIATWHIVSAVMATRKARGNYGDSFMLAGIPSRRPLAELCFPSLQPCQGRAESAPPAAGLPLDRAEGSEEVHARGRRRGAAS